jgi:hypothetical protein
VRVHGLEARGADDPTSVWVLASAHGTRRGPGPGSVWVPCRAARGPVLVCSLRQTLDSLPSTLIARLPPPGQVESASPDHRSRVRREVRAFFAEQDWPGAKATAGGREPCWVVQPIRSYLDYNEHMRERNHVRANRLVLSYLPTLFLIITAFGRWSDPCRLVRMPLTFLGCATRSEPAPQPCPCSGPPRLFPPARATATCLQLRHQLAVE